MPETSPDEWVASNESQQPPEGRPLGRRAFLGAAALIVASTHEALAGKPRQKPVNALLHEFPRNIPHIVRRREDLHEDAKHGLVVIRQLHWAKDLSRMDAKEVEQCQEEIRDALLFLLKHGHIDAAIYGEGRMAANEPRPDERYVYAPNAREQGLKNISELAEIGADRILEKEGKIRIKGAERTITYDRSGIVLEDRSIGNYNRILYEDRENVVLELVRQAKDRIACTIYGGAHDWENNILEWNDAFPDEKFSLLTLTPRAMANYDSRMRQPYKSPPVSPPPEQNLAGGRD